MAIRLPLTVVKTIVDTGTSGATNYDFIIPQDIDDLVFKVSTGATFTGTNPTCDIYVQTTDDGGTTWYDCANITQLTAAVTNMNAVFATVPVASAMRTSGASVLATGGAAASTTTARQFTGVPILSPLLRVTLKYGGTQLANTAVTVKVMANSQAPHA